MLTITTYDWVPQFPRGFVRDLRARWACEEAGLPYAVDTVPIKAKTAAHLARQPFHQVPMLQDGALSLFESGAIVLHLAEKSEALMRQTPAGRAEVLQWSIAALNSVEPAVMGWVLAHDFDRDEAATALALPRLKSRAAAMERVLSDRDWLASDGFSAADILMTEALRVGTDALGDFPALRAYIDRATARPAFQKAHADQMAHFAAADAAQGGA